MKTTQLVLFAKPLTPHLSELASLLKLAEMSVTVAPSFDAAERIVKALPTLALVVVDASADHKGAERLLAQVKDSNRRLPVLWFGDNPTTGGDPPDACLPATATPSELTERALSLLLDELYPPSLVSAFVSACNVALNTTFEAAVNCDQPILTRATVQLGNVGALMMLSDADTTAHLVVSTWDAVLFGLAERLGFDAIAGRNQLAIDMAKELANQIAGRMKATSNPLADLSLTLPYVVTSESFSIHSPTPKPSLRVQLEVDGAPIAVCFWWQTRRQPDPETERMLAELTSGDGLFF